MHRGAMSSVLLVVASIIVIACIILPIAGVLGATNSGQTGTGGSAGLPTTAPTVAAFPTVAPTATRSGPQLISTAVLGGTRDAFTAAYGAPTFKGPIPWYTYTASDGSTITFCFCSGLDGKDGQHAPSPKSWSTREVRIVTKWAGDQMRKTAVTEEQIAYALRQAEAGTPVLAVCRKLGISEQTF